MTARSAYAYVIVWATVCLIVVARLAWSQGIYALSRSEYWRFLFVPWKLTTFAMTAAGLILMAPYTGDPTWDYTDAAFMSVLTFLTAPWAVGVIYKTARRELPIHHGLVAACVWLFSASWSYDGYLLARDGVYPVTWLANLLASSVLYLAAGLFWNLDWRPETGALFAFADADWPQASSNRIFGRILWPALVFMALVGCMLLSFLWLGLASRG